MRRIFQVFVIVFCGAIGEVSGGLPAPIPFGRLSEDETRILVVRSSSNPFSHPALVNPRLSSGEEIAFQARFPKSGVYRLADGALIYELDWFCLEWEMLSSPDLVHLARLNRFGGPRALTFFEVGKETAEVHRDRSVNGFQPWEDGPQLERFTGTGQ